MNVVQAIAAIMAELPGIGKDSRSPQGYNFRGIEAITKETQKLCGKYGVVFVPRVIGRRTVELTVAGKPWTEEQLEVIYDVRGPSWRPPGWIDSSDPGCDDRIEVGPLWGLGRDNSDKGTNKSLTQCYKYALIQTFQIGDSSTDSDGHNPEADARSHGPDGGSVCVECGAPLAGHPVRKQGGGYVHVACPAAADPVEQGPSAAWQAVMAQWPNDEAFKAAHDAYGTKTATLSEAEKQRLKDYKTKQGIAWPLTPSQHEELMEMVSIMEGSRGDAPAEQGALIPDGS